MNKSHYLFRTICVMVIMALFAPATDAQDVSPQQNDAAAPDASSVAINEQVIDSLKLQIEGSTELSPENKQSALDLLTEARSFLSTANTYQAGAQQAQRDLESISKQRAELQQELERASQQQLQLPPSDADKNSLQTLLDTKLSERSKADLDVKALQARIDAREAEWAGIDARLKKIPDQKADIEKKIAAYEGREDLDLLEQARQLSHLAEKKQLDVEPNWLQSQLLLAKAQAGDEDNDLLKLRQRIAQQNIKLLDLETREISQAIERKLQTEAQKRRKKAEDDREQLQSAPEPWKNELARVAQKTVKYVQAEEDLQRQKREPREATQFALAETSRLEREHDELVDREVRFGGQRAFGALLRQQRSQLESPDKIRNLALAYNDEFEHAYSEAIRLRTSQKDLEEITENLNLTLKRIQSNAEKESKGDGETAVAVDFSILNEIVGQNLNEKVEVNLNQDEGVNWAPANPETVIQRVLDILAHQKEAIQAAISAADDYMHQLDLYFQAYTKYAEVTEELAGYIDERVLWIRSHDAITLETVTADIQSLNTLLDHKRWSQFQRILVKDFRANVITYVLVCGVWVFLLATSRWQSERIRLSGKKAASRLNLSMQPTIRALLMTFSKSGIIALPILFVSWRMLNAPESDQLLGKNLFTVGMGLYLLELVRNVNRPLGLGDSHFGWPTEACRLVSRQVHEFLIVAIPLLALIAILSAWRTDTAQEVESPITSIVFQGDATAGQQARVLGQSETLIRLLSIAMYLILAHKLHLLSHPLTGVTRNWFPAKQNAWLGPFLQLIHTLAFSLPIAMAVLTAIGFSYATEQLAWNLSLTIAICFGAVFLRGLCLRWLSLRQRRLAIDQARQKRAAQRTDGAAGEGLQVEDTHADLTVVSIQTKRLLNSLVLIVSGVVLWQIWSGIVPALNYVETIPGTGIPLGPTVASILIAILTFTAARNAPGMMEITLLEWLPLQKSNRYAIAAVTQYFIAIAGILAISDQLNISWESVQWLVAALSVGLGFGLQEIVANFVSGIIILFEQPVRLGDIVTIDDVSGVVSRIRIRATTITNWDRREYIVPNKEFITGRLMNWTLTDTVNRIIVEVGVAYGSDTRLVRDTILKCAHEHPSVLTDPAPVCTFEAFGDSSLNFTLRAFLANMELRLQVPHDLRTAIDDEFKELGIQIPFPQRDLHLRTSIPVPFADPRDFKNREEVMTNGQESSPFVEMSGETTDE